MAVQGSSASLMASSKGLCCLLGRHRSSYNKTKNCDDRSKYCLILPQKAKWKLSRKGKKVPDPPLRIAVTVLGYEIARTRAVSLQIALQIAMKFLLKNFSLEERMFSECFLSKIGFEREVRRYVLCSCLMFHVLSWPQLQKGIIRLKMFAN